MLIGVIVAISTGLVWLAAAYALKRSYRGLRRGRLATGTVWLLLALSPLIAFFAHTAWASYKEAQRAVEVRNFDRLPFPSSYPSTLEVYGYLNSTELLIYLDSLDIDIVYLIGQRPHRGTVKASVITLKSDCRGRGRRLLELVRRGKDSQSANDSECLNVERTILSADRSMVPAIVFLMDGQTTLRMPGAVWAGGNYEVRVRTVEADDLIDYWEWPYIDRPATPFAFFGLSFAARDNSDWRKYRNGGRLTFFATAVGLMEKVSP